MVHSVLHEDAQISRDLYTFVFVHCFSQGFVLLRKLEERPEPSCDRTALCFCPVGTCSGTRSLRPIWEVWTLRRIFTSCTCPASEAVFIVFGVDQALVHTLLLKSGRLGTASISSERQRIGFIAWPILVWWLLASQWQLGWRCCYLGHSIFSVLVLWVGLFTWRPDFSVYLLISLLTDALLPFVYCICRMCGLHDHEFRLAKLIALVGGLFRFYSLTLWGLCGGTPKFVFDRVTVMPGIFQGCLFERM